MKLLFTVFNSIWKTMSLFNCNEGSYKSNEILQELNKNVKRSFILSLLTAKCPV